MLSIKKMTGLFTLFVGLTFAMFSLSAGQGLTDLKSKSKKATLSGTVVAASNQQPVSDATVKVPMLEKKTQTDKRGTFNIQALNPGTYELKVKHSDFKTYSKTVEIKDQNKQLVIKLESKS